MNAIAVILAGRRAEGLALFFLGLGLTSVGSAQPRAMAAALSHDNDTYQPQFGREIHPIDGMPQPTKVYFPPWAPRLDTHVELASVFEANKPAPSELAPFVNEPFYAPLSTRFAEGGLSSKQRQKLDAYLAAKLRLQNELRSHLAELATVGLAERERQYAELARGEDPQIDALEQTAQQLRVEMIHGGLFQSNVDWNNNREWHLGASRFRTAVAAMSAQYQLMRSAAFYQDGFNPAQRRLLLEVSMELGNMPIPTTEDAEPEAGTTPTDTNPPLFFSPETSRIHLPVNLPPDLAEKVAKYEQDKSELKKELKDSVYREDTDHFYFTRNRASAALAQQQQVRIEALEALAEEIRRGLASLPNVSRPPEAPEIPPALAARITDFLHNRLGVQQDLLVLLAEARRNLEIQRVGYTKSSDGKYALNLAIRPYDRDEVQLRKLQANFALFNRTASLRTAQLAKELDVIHQDAARVIGADAGAAGEKAVYRFVSECAETIERREDWELYRDYRTAVLEPGLSPQQRRLLFDAALVDLKLPLPGLERSPLDSNYRPPQLTASGPGPAASELPH